MTLHKTHQALDNTTAPARDGSREGTGVKSLSVQLQKDSKEDVGIRRAF